MNLYYIRNNTSYERKWTWSASIHPRSREVTWSCPDCGATARYPGGAFDVTIEEGTAYPDLLGCGAYPFLIVSDRVIESWRRHDINSYVAFPVGVVAALETKLSPKDAPQYFRVEVTGEVKVDIPSSGGCITRFCTRCGTIATEPMVIRKFAFLHHSWDGNALVRDQRLFPRVNFCTEAVKHIAEAEKHTNVRFEEMIPMPED